MHLHTVYSDGVLTPHELVQKAASAGLSVISITDHDNVGAIEEAIEFGRSVGVEVVPGVELSIELNEKDIHLLAYFFDYRNKRMLEYLAYFREERLRRAERIVEKLNHINVPLKMDAVLDRAGVGSVGRPHIASALVENGLIETYNEAFLKYIGTGMPAYEKKYQLSPVEAVKLITSAGGLSFLAHPGKYTSEVELLQLIDAGVDGIEVVHPSHSKSQQEFYRNLVQQYFLLESGGSDFHGGKKNDDEVLGAYTVPLQVVDEMRNRLFK
ncbi:MAG TPA: PHP domain-containing protein [Bacteroidota bacterium]|nr:PHP domain-containing protein [Bacteroidota bacterium]